MRARSVRCYYYSLRKSRRSSFQARARVRGGATREITRPGTHDADNLDSLSNLAVRESLRSTPPLLNGNVRVRMSRERQAANYLAFCANPAKSLRLRR